MLYSKNCSVGKVINNGIIIINHSQHNNKLPKEISHNAVLKGKCSLYVFLHLLHSKI